MRTRLVLMHVLGGVVYKVKMIMVRDQKVRTAIIDVFSIERIENGNKTENKSGAVAM